MSITYSPTHAFRWPVKPCHRRLSTIILNATVVSTEVPLAAFKPSKPTLVDLPVSNNGGRIRFLMYKKGLEDAIDIISPKELGGLRSPEYTALNPQGKMPLLVLPDGTSLPESQVIESYLLDKYKGSGPDLLPETPELRALAALAARIHDLYIVPIQGCLYRPMKDPAARAKQLQDISFQLNVLENLVKGPFFCGDEISYADGALMPTFVFLTHILPRHFGWESVFTGRPKLGNWWNAISNDPAAAKVIEEIENALNSWEADNRWEEKGILAQVSDTSFDWTCGC